MNGWVNWFARNAVAANLLMIGIIGGGIGALSGIEREIFPEISADTISVSVAYPGASPEEVEESIVIKIEEEVRGLDGVDKIESTSAEGNGTVLIELLNDADSSRVLDDVKSRVDAIETFPEEAEEPVIRELTLRRQVVNVAVHGPLDEVSLRKLAERVRDDLAATDGITQVELVAVRPYEIAVEVGEDQLRANGLTFDEVANAVRRGSVDLAGGGVETDSGERLLRTKGQAYNGADFEDLVVRTWDDGTRVRVRDVANVRDGFEDSDQSTLFDGQPAALVQVFRIGSQDAIELSTIVKDYCEDSARDLPEGVTLTPWLDQSELLQQRQDLLIKNGWQGFLLVFLVLALFLRFDLAMWVTIGVPISFLGALLVMPLIGASINMLSLFAFILVLGIVVDDAIVVGENVHSHGRRGKRGIDAAVDGTKEVAVPVTFAILTTVAAFLPLFFVPGNLGPFFAVIPAVVVPTLIFSMVESKLILPAHLSHLKPDNPNSKNPWSRFQRRFAHGLEWVANNLFRRALELALRFRYVTIASACAMLFLTLGALLGGHLRFTFFPSVDGDNVVCNLTLPLGTPAEVTASRMERVEEAANRMRQQFLDEGKGDPVQHVLISVGDQPYRQIQAESGGNVSAGGFAASHFGEANIQLVAPEVRNVSSAEVAERWRELTGEIEGASELRFSSSLISVGDDLDVRLTGQNLDELQQAAGRLTEWLERREGVSDISDSFELGKLQLEMQVRDEAEALGVTQQDLARQVRQAFFGEEAQRVQRGRDDVKVMVRYPEAERESLADVERLRIRTQDGSQIPFATVADVEIGRGFSAIKRTNAARTVSVTGAVDEETVNLEALVAQIQTEVLPSILQDYPGMRYSFEGERKEQQETLEGLKSGFLFALLAIYGLMAIPFKSYVQPLIVMAVIPFGLIGAAVGHALLGLQFSILSIFGLVALAGVVVNDSLVLVDFINRHRDEPGSSLQQAVRDAGVKRFRPILLTSLTTFAGLTPLLFETSVQAQFLIPMAVSLAFGVLFATFLSLVLVPSVYLVLDDFRRGFRWLYPKTGSDDELTPDEGAPSQA